MKEGYLWDRSGPPDPSIVRLEQALAPLQHDGRWPPTGQLRWRWVMAAAAACLAAIAFSNVGAPPAPATMWQVKRLEGMASLGSGRAAISMPLRAGQVLRTTSVSEVSLRADAVGELDLGPDSELRATSDRQMVLNRGRLHVFIWAPPREFVVDTPSARAVDLGCEYTIDVDSRGNGKLRVSTGWVAFRYGGDESFIPAGAACLMRKGMGPGIPFFEDAPEAFRQAVAAFQRGDSTALAEVLKAARPRDGLTLWHLLTRVPARDRGEVFDRFIELVNLSPEVSRDAVLRRRPQAIDLCWNALNLENTAWWRGWERRWE
jgi:hypothetical protein